jgi:phospholipid/cholesterol/gamma-HCH transport system substrate-binding protein
MKELSLKKMTILGLFIIGGLVILLGGIILIGNLKESYGSKIEYYTLFDDVNGLHEGSNIWLAGLKVGLVHGMQFDDSGKVKVNLLIDKKAAKYITSQSVIKLGRDGFIGNRILVVSKTNGGQLLNEGEFIKSETTLDPDEMMKTFKVTNDNLAVISGNFKIISERLVNGTGTIGKIMTNDSLYYAMKSSITSVNRIAQKVITFADVMNSLAKSMNTDGSLVKEIATDTVLFGQIENSVSKIQLLMKTSNELMEILKNQTTNPKSSIGVLMSDEETANNLKETMKNLAASTEKLNVNLEAMQSNVLLKGYFKKKVKK